MIKYIKTESFKKLGDSIIEFSSGTNVITGANGNGKSTIFSAIRFALFGTSAIAASKATIPTWGNTKAKVTLAFNDFIIVRSLSDCKVYKAVDGIVKETNEYKVAEGNKPCTEWVKEHLGVDHKMFSIFNMSMQGDTGALITLGATELNRIVESYSGVDVLDKVMKLINSDIALYSSKLVDLAYTDTTEIESKITETRDKLQQYQDKLSKLKDEVNVSKAKVKELETEYYSGLENNKTRKLNEQKIESLKTALVKLKGDLAKEQELLKEYEKDTITFSAQDAVEQIDVLNDQLTYYYHKVSERTSTTNKIDKLNDKIKLLEQRHKDEQKYSKQRDSLSEQIEEASVTLSKEQEKQNELNSKITSLKSALKDGKCPKCKRPFENFNEAELSADLEEVLTKFEIVTRKVNELKATKKALTKELSSIPNYGDDNQYEADQLRLELAELEANELELIKLIDSLNKSEVEQTIDELTEELASYREKIKVVNRCKENINTLTNEITNTTANISSITIPEYIDTDDIRGRLASEKEVYESLLDLYDEFKELKVSLTLGLKEIERKCDVLKQTNKMYKELSDNLGLAKQLYSYLKKSRVTFMRDVWSTIVSVASDFISSTTGGWITEVGRNDTGEFTFTENGIVAPASSEASGAQKEFIGTAIRIGLSMCLNDDKALLMLDEPTAGMSEDNADKLATGLLSVSGQKVIITHRNSEKLTAANVITL